MKSYSEGCRMDCWLAESRINYLIKQTRKAVDGVEDECVINCVAVRTPIAGKDIGLIKSSLWVLTGIGS